MPITPFRGVRISWLISLRNCWPAGSTARGWTRTVRLARTIADLDGSAGVLRRHIAEALIYRRTTVDAQGDFDRATAARSLGVREEAQTPFVH